MTDPRPQTRRRLEPDQLTALWYLCCSDNTTPLERVIEILDPPARDLIPGLSYAIERKRLNMIHYLLEYGVPVNGHRVLDAIRERSIPILEMLREYGWDDVNSMVYDREAVTALTWVVLDYPSLISVSHFTTTGYLHCLNVSIYQRRCRKTLLSLSSCRGEP